MIFCQSNNIDAQNYVNPVKDRFPILAYHSLNEGHSGNGDYKLLHDAGFNLSYTCFSRMEDLDSSLTMANKYNVKLVARCTKVSQKELVEALKLREGLGLYFVADEPSKQDFPSVAAKVSSIRKRDKSHLTYINLIANGNKKQLGTNSYEDYIETFLSTVSPDFLSYDFYPFPRDKFMSTYYENLEIIYKICKRRNLLFWGFVRTGVNDRYWFPTEGKLRLQAFSNIAYGAQGIQYFTYRVSTGVERAILEKDFSPSPLYDIVSRINKDIHAIEKYILGAKKWTVWHTGSKLPKGTHSIKYPVGSLDRITYSGSGLILSTFTNRGNQYLMVVNRDYEKSQRVSFRFSSPTTVLHGTGSRKRYTKYSDMIDAGSFLLMRLSE